MKQTFYLYTQEPANGSSDGRWSTTGILSTSYDALSKQRDANLKNANANLEVPTVHTIHTVNFSNELRERAAMQKLEQSFGAAKVSTAGIVSHSHDLFIERDYFHDTSEWIYGQDSSLKIQSEIAIRNQSIQPMKQALMRTPPQFIPDLNNKWVKASMAICYADAPLSYPCLSQVVQEMAKRLDTAGKVMDFQYKFEENMQKLHEEYPTMGLDQRTAQAIADTAVHFQMHKSHTNLMEQEVYANIAKSYNANMPEAIQNDDIRRIDAYSYAIGAIDDHLAQNGAYIDNATEQNLRLAIMTRVGAAVTEADFRGESSVQNIIKSVAKEMETAERAQGNHRCGFSLANIADAAEEKQEQIEERENHDEVSIED